jgi:hypothetical protein
MPLIALSEIVEPLLLADARIEFLKEAMQNQEALIQSREMRIMELSAAIRRIAEADHKDWPKAIDDARRLVG